MAWNYRIINELEIVELRYSGIVDAVQLREATSAAIKLEKEKGLIRFIVDTSDLELAPSVSLLNIYELPAEQYVREEADRSARVAILPPTSAEAYEAVQFYETVCRNRGWMVKICEDREQALQWLG